MGKDPAFLDLVPREGLKVRTVQPLVHFDNSFFFKLENPFKCLSVGVEHCSYVCDNI